MNINLIRINKGIYEQDIIYLDGSVEYTGQILISSNRSRLEVAKISIGGYSCDAVMERFNDGTAVIYNYTKAGQIYKNELFLEAQSFENAFYGAMDKDARYISYHFFRRLKQYATLISQGICLFIFLFSIGFLIKNGFVPAVIIMMVLSFILLLMLGRLYSFYRCHSIKEHTSFLLTKECHDETDDFWNVDKDK